MRVVLVVAAALLLTGSAAAEPTSATGWASAYAPGVMEATVRYRLEHDVWRVPPPADWYTAAGYIATNNCAQVGSMATLIDPGGREWRVLVADCGGDEPGAGAQWMTENGIAAEMDAVLWRRLTGMYGRPLRIEVRYDG